MPQIPRLPLIACLILLPSIATAAPAPWFDQLFAKHRPAHHRAATPKAPGAAPAAAPVVTPPPVPRPRPADVAAEQATTPPSGGKAVATTLPAAATPASPTPAAETATPTPVPLAPAAPAATPATPASPVAIPAAAETTPAAPAVAPANSTAAPTVPEPRSRPADAGAKPDSNSKAPTDRPADQPPAAAPAGPQSTAPTEGESATTKPPRIYQTACPAVISGLVEAKPLPPISEGQCGEPSPLSVTGVMVNGRLVKLTEPAIFGCPMATDLPAWVADVDNYVWSTANTRIKAVLVGGTYECRPMRTEDGSSNLSEHGRADAIDFVGFQLEDGRTVTVTSDYNSTDPKLAKLMHFAHDAACTKFTTVLGPDANALHHDHFHLDLGCHGKTCTYRLCE